MNIPKIAGFLGIIFVLFWIISAPTTASSSVSKIMTNTRTAGNSMVTFMQGIMGGGPTTSGTLSGTTRSGTTTNGSRTNGTTPSGSTTNGTTTTGAGR